MPLSTADIVSKIHIDKKYDEEKAARSSDVTSEAVAN